jgi:hypothetical protein
MSDGIEHAYKVPVRKIWGSHGGEDAMLFLRNICNYLLHDVTIQKNDADKFQRICCIILLLK